MRTIDVNLNMIFEMKKKNKAQITSEYAILVSLIIAALVGMQIYLKRGIQARLRDAADYPVASGVFTTSQYEPGDTEINRTDIRYSDIEEELIDRLAISRETTEILSSNITTIIGNIQ